MKHLLSLLVVFSFLLAGKSISAQKNDLTCFNKIDVSSGIDVELVLDKNCGIEWNLTNIEPDKVIAEIVDKTLRLKTKFGIYKDAKIKAKVYYNELTGLITSGRGVIWSQEELYVDNININLGGGGEARLTLHADTLTAALAEGSVITIEGEADVMDVKVGTGATFSGYNLDSRVAKVLSNSGAKAKIAVSENLYAKATSKGFIGYIGEPKFLVKDATLGGEISQTVKEQ
jgi:Putative auto-transporter adhesin, head GIN domain